jgi:branched-chain amino acid transport system substrate-binding protein
MGKRVWFFALVSAAVMATVTVTAATGARQAEPGLSSDKIVLGAAVPLTGPASSYGTIARAVEAYFKWYNDTRGGVFGRKIQFIYHDHAYVPAQAAQVAKQLVEQDQVFACFQNLGTEHNEAMQDYLKSKGVPNLFVATGASEWGTNFRNYPMQMGYQPDYVSEGRIYGQFIRTKVPQAKIAILAQDDSYGNDLLNGFLLGLGPAKSKIVETQKYQVTDADVTSYVAKLKASGANVLCIFATPTFAIQAYVFANRLGWKPLIVNNAVSGTSNIMVLASEGGKNKLVEGTITTTVLKDPTDPRWKNDAGMKRYRALLAKYAKGASPDDVYHVYGMAVAYETVALFKRLGANPTRVGLMKAARSISDAKNPFLLPGVSVKTGKGDNFPIQQGQLQRWTKGRFVPVGGLWTSKRN